MFKKWFGKKQPVIEEVDESLGLVDGVDESLEQVDGSLGQVDEELGEVDGSLGQVDESLGLVDESLGQVDEELGLVDESLEQVDGSLGQVDEELGQVDESLGLVDGSLGQVDEELGLVDESLGQVDESLEQVDESLEQVDESLGQVDEELGEVDGSLEQVDGSLGQVDEELGQVDEELGQVDEVQEASSEGKGGFFKRLFSGLDKTRKQFTERIDQLINNYGEIDDDLFDELEEILIMADVGMTTALKLINGLREELKVRKITDASLVKSVLRDVMIEELTTGEEAKLNVASPSVVLVIGVNGAGKTTSIGKIANLLRIEGNKVLLAAADTFRAAAIDQLVIWGQRAGIDVISQAEGSDPASVVYDAIHAAKARKTDVLICDTAGRLHNKKNLMNELNKIFRIIDREYPEANREVLLVLDATTGQNAIQQAKLFQEVAEITGVVLTKLDGTAKGGFIFAVKGELGIPVKLVGVGEGINDLQHFDPVAFSNALMEMEKI